MPHVRLILPSRRWTAFARPVFWEMDVSALLLAIHAVAQQFVTKMPFAHQTSLNRQWTAPVRLVLLAMGWLVLWMILAPISSVMQMRLAYLVSCPQTRVSTQILSLWWFLDFISCVCNSGFKGNGTSCIPVDGCNLRCPIVEGADVRCVIIGGNAQCISTGTLNLKNQVKKTTAIVTIQSSFFIL